MQIKGIKSCGSILLLTSLLGGGCAFKVASYRPSPAFPLAQKSKLTARVLPVTDQTGTPDRECQYVGKNFARGGCCLLSCPCLGPAALTDVVAQDLTHSGLFSTVSAGSDSSGATADVVIEPVVWHEMWEMYPIRQIFLHLKLEIAVRKGGQEVSRRVYEKRMNMRGGVPSRLGAELPLLMQDIRTDLAQALHLE